MYMYEFARSQLSVANKDWCLFVRSSLDTLRERLGAQPTQTELETATKLSGRRGPEPRLIFCVLASALPKLRKGQLL